MKKMFVSAAALMIAAASFAQSKSEKPANDISIGVDGGLPLGDFKQSHKFGVGGTVKFAHNFDENIALTLTSGYLSFPGKDLGFGLKFPAQGIIPIKAGARYTFPGGVYAEPQLGVSILNNDGGSAFTYAGNLGYTMTPGIDVSARYEGMSKNGSSIGFIGFRLAYSFGF
jgi:hypothetical protein